MIPTARNIPHTQPSARQDALYPERGPSSLSLSLGEWPRLPSTARIGRGPADSPTSPEGVGRLFFTARIERPPLYRGGSASKKNGLPAPSHSSEAARCASKGIVPTTPLPFQHPDYSTLYPLAAKQVPRIALMPDIPCSARAWSPGFGRLGRTERGCSGCRSGFRSPVSPCYPASEELWHRRSGCH